MKWVLIVVWMAPGGNGIEIAQFPTLRECFETGTRARQQYDGMSVANIVNFSCAPSHGEEPTCGGTGQQPCKDL